MKRLAGTEKHRLDPGGGVVCEAHAQTDRLSGLTFRYEPRRLQLAPLDTSKMLLYIRAGTENNGGTSLL